MNFCVKLQLSLLSLKREYKNVNTFSCIIPTVLFISFYDSIADDRTQKSKNIIFFNISHKFDFIPPNNLNAFWFSAYFDFIFSITLNLTLLNACIKMLEILIVRQRWKLKSLNTCFRKEQFHFEHLKGEIVCNIIRKNRKIYDNCLRNWKMYEKQYFRIKQLCSTKCIFNVHIISRLFENL